MEVQDVLDEAVTDPDADVDTAFMRHLLDANSGVGPEDLNYEDWVLPMEVTGGRVCLKIWPSWVDEFPEINPDDRALYFRRTENGLIERGPPDEHGRSTMTDMHFAPTIEVHLPNVEPVLLEDTWFAEDGDAEESQTDG